VNRARPTRGRPGLGLRRRADVLTVIALGGAAGSLARWGLDEAIPFTGHGFPWATFTVNVTGSLALGAVMVVIDDIAVPSRYLRPFVAVGLLGGFTTFSTYMLETRTLAAGGQDPTAALYLVASLLAGLLAVRAATAGTQLLFAARRRRVP
jgi:fluoride exporter